MHQDYIMRIVEQFVQAILAIMQRRKAGEYKEAREQVRTAARYLLRVDLDLLLLYDNKHILDHFKDFAGHVETEKCVLGADLFYELAMIEEAENRSDNALRLKELCLYLYAIGLQKEVQFQKPQYFEKVSAIIEELKNHKLSEETFASLDSYQVFIKSLKLKDQTILSLVGNHMDIQALIKEYIEDSGAVGAAAAIIDNGKISFYTYGKKSVNADDLISEDTIFEIGSVTKVFTTLLLADMVAKGEVQLDDPVEMYLPGVKIPELDGKKITLRHLASHTSGIPRMPDNFAPKDPSNPYQDYTIERLFEYLESCTLAKPPGESFEYSNIGMGLLGHILSIRSGKSYEERVKDLICRKLNMPKTVISLSNEMAAVFASGHHLATEVSYWDIPGLAGAGALRSNIRDMANFLAANMDSKSPIHTLLSQCHQQQYAPMPGFAVGLGWMFSSSNQADLIWHNGGTGGFRSYLGFNPKLQKGIVILSNSTEDWPDELGLVVLDPDYKRPAIDKSLANNPEYLNQFAGSYTATLPGDLPNQELTISVFGKLLASLLSGGEVGMLYPESYGVFGVKGFPDGKVIFKVDDAGKIVGVEARLVSNGTLLWEAVPVNEKIN